MAQNAAVTGTFEAQLTGTAGALTVDQFVQLPNTPGNVGICISGGGSRSLSAGMGQLRALSFLQLNGRSLLSQTKTMATVSGGSWLGVAFSFLTPGTTDAQFLNDYVADPGRLVPSATPGHSIAETLDALPEGNIGQQVSSDLFSLPALLVEAFLHYKHLGTPPNFLWQVLCGMHILAPYGLYAPGPEGLPVSLFSWDAATLAAQVTGPNPALSGETAYLVASGAARARRPVLICNFAMFLNEPGTKFQYLAPVQSTPFMTGIVGAPSGADANGSAAGGGGVTSFAFSSNPTAVAADTVTVEQSRQLSLAEIAGASSAVYANSLQNLFAGMQQDPGKFLALLAQRGSTILAGLRRWFSDVHLAPAAGFLQANLATPTLASFSSLKSDLFSLQDLIPEFQYWPVAGVQPAAQTKPSRFADAGNLEDLGVNATLAYSDVDNLIVFANTDTPIAPADRGLIDAQGQEIPNTRVVVTSDLPPLFGYQPYQPGSGYLLYAGDPSPSFPQGKNSRVFAPAKLGELLQELWAASGSGTNATPAVYKQRLDVQDNAWFGVRGGRNVTLLWVYNNRVKAWYDQLNPQVQAILGNFQDPTSFHSFPNYSSVDTDLAATEINLLASLAAWIVAADENRAQFLSMYQDV